MRPPRAPSTRGFRTPLRLGAIRPRESVELDRDPELGELAPFVPWSEFLDEFAVRWHADSPHVTIVGKTGSGKTVLAREVIDLRRYVVVLATKARDPNLYTALQRRGFVIRSRWAPNPADEPRVIFKPPLEAPTKEARLAQAEAFREALVDIYSMGNETVDADEVRYLTQNLGLATELETLWLQGRSLGVRLVVSTQRPVSIPILAFDADHLFFFRTTDQRDVVTMSEFTGDVTDAVRAIVPRLPKFEVLYIHTETATLRRTRVDL